MEGVGNCPGLLLQRADRVGANDDNERDIGRAFRGQPRLFAAIVMILMTMWAALCQSAVGLGMPHGLLKVSASEARLLRRPWTGVRLFGAILRNTPLRHLGGRVFLSQAPDDIPAIVRGLHDAENVHLWALLFSCPWLIVWAWHGRWISILCGLAVHVPLNIFPILHLRSVTFRVNRYLARVQTRRRIRSDGRSSLSG